MPEILHIVNEAATCAQLQRARREDDCIAWWDNLHMGPVNTTDLESLARFRAEYFGRHRLGDQDELLERYRRRNHAFERFRQYEEVVLWFDGGLEDQLQLVQLLAWLDRFDALQTRISLICIDHYPGIFRFRSLSQLKAAQLARLFPKRQEVTWAQMMLATDVWQAIVSPDPSSLPALFNQDLSALPLLKPALQRWHEEYPLFSNGLGRTDHQILRMVYRQHRTPAEIYSHFQRGEPWPFWQPGAFWRRMLAMVECDFPLLVFSGPDPFKSLLGPKKNLDAFQRCRFYLTEVGLAVLQEHEDHIALNGIDRWIGGVHLRPENVWRRHHETRRLSKSAV